MSAATKPPSEKRVAEIRVRLAEYVFHVTPDRQAALDLLAAVDVAEQQGRVAGLREAADDMERVIGFGVMRIPVVGMATTLRDKATAIERGEI